MRWRGEIGGTLFAWRELFHAMGDDAERFRMRARECRQLARNARDPDWRDKLNQIAGELEEEAARMDAEDAAKDGS